jgi:hypothetical protein
MTHHKRRSEMTTATMQDGLNVKENNLNNKRLSRLQGVILKILATVHPDGYSRTDLAHIVAGAYGNRSLVERPLDALGVFIGMNKDPETREIGKAFSLKRPRVLAPKFSVSFSRSIKGLLQQDLVKHEWTPRGYGVFITGKGLSRIQNKKVRVNAKFWDAFLASSNKGEREKHDGN